MNEPNHSEAGARAHGNIWSKITRGREPLDSRRGTGAAMGRVVQKYGGSSVADADSIKRVAKRIVATKQLGHDVVVVISAMGDTTDDLMGLALEVSPFRHLANSTCC